MDQHKDSSSRKLGRPANKAVAQRLKDVAEPEHGGLTLRQRQLLQVIKESIDTVGYAPSIREIARRAGLSSTSSVSYQLNVLEERGFIRRDPNLPRAMVVTLPGEASAAATERPALDSEASYTPDARSVPVPLVGSIAAGGPILAEEYVDDVFALPEQIVGNGEVFMLRVKGESMVEAAICDGDWVVVRKQPTAVNGDIVAALLDDEATVKTYRRTEDAVWLLPHNASYSPIDGTHATIMGKVVAVIRRL